MGRERWVAVPSWPRFYNKGSLASSFYQAKFEVIKYDQHPNQFILMNSFWAKAAKTSKLPDYNQRAIKRFFVLNFEASKKLCMKPKSSTLLHNILKLGDFCSCKFVLHGAAYLVVDMSTKAKRRDVSVIYGHDWYETSNLNGLTGTIEGTEAATDTLKCWCVFIFIGAVREDAMLKNFPFQLKVSLGGSFIILCVSIFSVKCKYAF